MFVMESHYALYDVEAEFLNIVCLSFSPQMFYLTIPSMYSILLCFQLCELSKT